ncbi:MAG: polyribonucleotide nucleotidyltransferase [Candidatus Cardinium sp.]|uniref:polyribonucleotide nucleotidyltransferase n=1 Tax=Cardinium endosymbiont of Dermatophagoides farinae TaxID=2597823 RepID=UPI001183691C|nr:polyribonucleotide nucleotidyltransferase [Cardinium endosymbiont of Dermatophagoides farinae]TSJ81070.1 polyribonucleotide nucleotidyltransferase [Cardinium endosymbiont of Dermatophagoides farinae]UWW97104.1 MAG: polyribonucleotide nucleotidyltransferase [Candidatus Cardinium sp.]
MLRKLISKTIQLPDNRVITIETGKLATQADGSVLVRMGNTMLLAAVVSKAAAEESGFLPLSVDYQEKFAASGKIPGGFLKREGRLGDHEILIARLVDRAIRPLFPKGFNNEIQINISLISADETILPDALAALAASSALSVSSIPFHGPISEVRVARVDGAFLINPPSNLLEKADMNLMVAASDDHILMIEGEMSEVQEADMLAAIRYAHDAIKLHCQVQRELMDSVGVEKSIDKAEDGHGTLAYPTALREAIYADIYAVAKQHIPSKALRKEAFMAVAHRYSEQLAKDQNGQEVPIAQQKAFVTELQNQAIRALILNENIRLDGRLLDQIRPIESEIDYLPSAHGSALFTRGETQSLTTVTLGSKFDEQIIDRAMEDGYNRFMLHYNFPGFSTGEVKPNRGPSRREIGHGNLAMRALKAVLPPDKENLYTIRVVSDILESNGSSSMATVCAGSLALMDAGIPIKAAVSGIAMGMVTDPTTGRFAVLSDILGDEDQIGDMDFKVTGTHQGITACQMDMKVAGISYAMLEQALHQAKAGRLHILQKMETTIAVPRSSGKPHAPKIVTIEVEKEMIGAIIGPGGKVIQEIQKETTTSIDIVEQGHKGIVTIFAGNQEMLQKAAHRIKTITAKPSIGEVYIGKVKSVLNYGAFVEFMPGKDGFLHVSEVRLERIEDLEDVLEVGEELQVKLIGVDPKTGKYRLSRKVLLSPDAVAAGG